MTRIAYQLYSSRNFAPLPDTLTMLSSLGYELVEGYGALLQNPAELRQALAGSGMGMPTAHVGLDQLEQDPDSILSLSREAGIGTVIVPFIDPRQRPGDGAGWRALAARIEAAARPLKEAGIGIGWHNHDFELTPLPDGTVPLTHLAAGAPELGIELDLGWLVRAGADPLDWIARLSGRIVAAHIKDIAPDGQALNEDGWADVGHGTTDWPPLLAALGSAGCDLLVIEHDNPSDDHRFASRSLTALQNLTGATS